jgi:hypothetical protein
VFGGAPDNFSGSGQTMTQGIPKAYPRYTVSIPYLPYPDYHSKDLKFKIQGGLILGFVLISPDGNIFAQDFRNYKLEY